MTDTRWNGEPCTAHRITAIVADATFPLYWARHLVGTRRNIVEVTYGGDTFYLDDEAGEAWTKVTNGGSPRWAHSNINIIPDSIQDRAEDASPELHIRMTGDTGTDLHYSALDGRSREQALIDAGLFAARMGHARPRFASIGATPELTATEATETETTARLLAALHQSAEQDITRVIDLYERWVKAGPPPLGTSLARWWDARLVELHQAIGEQPARTTPNNPPTSSNTADNPPGSTREQLPAALLALIDIPPYRSTACETAQLLAQQMPKYTHRRIELGDHSDRLHERCRRNNKFTGQLCTCHCHTKEPTP